MGLLKDLGTFLPTKTNPGVPPRVWTVAWNYNGTSLASGGDDKCVRVWKYAPNGDEILINTVTHDDSHTKAVRTLAFTHCDNFLVSGSFDASMVVFCKEEDGMYSEINTLEGHESEVKCVAFNASDEYMASCSRDKTVWFWHVDEEEDYQVTSVLQAHTQDVKFVVWHPTENLLVSCSYDFSIKFFRFDDEDWVTQQKFDNAHEGTVWCADFDSEGNRLVTVGEDHVVQIWKREYSSQDVTRDTWKSVCKYIIEQSKWPLYSVSWNKTTNLIAVAGGDSTIRILSIEELGEEFTLSEQQVIENHDGEVNCVAWNPGHPNILASCGDDGTIRLTQVEL